MSHWIAAFGSVFAFLACKGLLVFFATMSALGVSLTLNGTTWMALILVGASVALVGFAINFTRHKNWLAIVLAMIGAGAVYYVYGVKFTEWIETAGLVTLLAAAVIDYWSLSSNRAATNQATT